MTTAIDLKAVAAGSRPASATARRVFRAASTAERTALLDVMLRAAPGAPPCLDLLLEILRRHRLLHPPIRRYLLADDDVDAAEQQALVAIAYGAHSYRGTSSARSWMNQIAANEAKMLIRSRERHTSRAAGTVDDHAAAFVQRLSTFVADEVVVTSCLEQLRPEWQRALVLREEGLSYDDLATRLGVPVGTAKTWVSRARRALADLLIEHSPLG